jgi:Family of unknown function (DUF6527)
MIRAIKFPSIQKLRQESLPGSYLYRAFRDGAEPAGMAFICPCGCGNESWMAFEGSAQPGACWQWNGNDLSPTLTPSVKQRGCGWHGWLTNGYWKAV